MDIPAPNAWSEDTPIWRYMDLGKFLAMLKSKSLWFCKAAKFQDDPYEGFCRVTGPSLPKDEHGPQWLTDGAGTSTTMSLIRMLAEFAHIAEADYKNPREHLYVSSWCLSKESMAMWEIYGAYGSGVAIKSSIAAFKRAVRFPIPSQQVRLGEVLYHDEIDTASALQVDLTSGSIPLPGPGIWQGILELGFHKRICFKYENEWRAAIYQDAWPECGCDMDCDLNELVDSVVVGPKAEGFLLEVLSAVMERFDLRKQVSKSGLLMFPEPR